MPIINYPESDWKLFRKRISDWQEAYMEKLCKEYVEILSASGSSADRFWAVEERVKEDKKKVGVQAVMRRSQMFFNHIRQEVPHLPPLRWGDELPINT